MQSLDVLKKLQAGLAALGTRRLVVLALSGLFVFVAVGASGYVLSRPQREVLYSGLDQEDVTRIGAALSEAGIDFDVSVTGDSVSVGYGVGSKARMILARRGLPRSDSAGYELFDKLGSLGLTTFMQQVTRVRALEGELARTIQQVDGIRAARVHLAMRNEASFRSAGDQPTASVVIRADRNTAEQAANAIRHLVAAAIPGLSPSQVTVMSAEGILLTSTEDSISAAPEKLIGLERQIAADIEGRISKTIAPYLGVGQFTVSVSAKLNADRKQISETAFDPNSRVERSIRTIKESGEAENASGSDAVSVEQNIPVEETPKSNGDNSRERKDRKEELTNYEINSKSIATTSEGYGIDHLSVAIVVNRGQIAKSLGDAASDTTIEEKISEIERLSSSAAGLVKDRGDVIEVSAVAFSTDAEALTPVEGNGTLDVLAGHLGSIVNATALIVISLLVLLLGFRPALRVILNQSALPPAYDQAQLLPGARPLPQIDDLSSPNRNRSGAIASATESPSTTDRPDPVLDSLTRGAAHDPTDRLVKIVELDPDRAVQVLKQWLNEPKGNAA